MLLRQIAGYTTHWMTIFQCFATNLMLGKWIWLRNTSTKRKEHNPLYEFSKAHMYFFISSKQKDINKKDIKK